MATRVDFTWTKGDKYLHQVTWKDSAGVVIDITSFVAKLQVRKPISAAAATVELTEGSGLTNGGAAGTIDIQFLKAHTNIIPDGSFYDLQLADGSGEPTTIIEGRIRANPQVTT